MPPSKRTDAYHHGDLRAALLQAAVAAIGERGLPGLSLRECARRVGVSHAAPYRHFADKDALLWAIFDEGFAALHEAGRRAMEEHSDPRQRLDAYGVAYVRFALDHPAHHRVMFTSVLAPRSDGPAHTQDTESFDLLRACAADLVPPEEVEVAALSYWSLVHGLAMLIQDGRVPTEHIDSEEKVEALTRATFAQWRKSGDGPASTAV